MRICLVHPLAGDFAGNRARLSALAAELTAEFPADLFVNPADELRGMADEPWDDLMLAAVMLLRDCDAALLCGHWARSRGCRELFRFALAAGKPLWTSPAMFRDQHPSPAI